MGTDYHHDATSVSGTDWWQVTWEEISRRPKFVNVNVCVPLPVPVPVTVTVTVHVHSCVFVCL